MSKSAASIVLNVEKFIKDVENRPAIWNRNYHCNKPFLEQMWVELSGIHQLPIVVLKAKWKGLRDNFRVEYKRIPRTDNGDFLISPDNHESKWTHYYNLLFLTDHMRHRLPKSEPENSPTYMGLKSEDDDNDYETLVTPDLKYGLIRIPDSDEEFDEDDDEEESGHSVDAIETKPQVPTLLGKLQTMGKTQPLTKETLSKINNVKTEKNGNGKRPSSVNSDGIVANHTRSHSIGSVPAAISPKKPRLSEDDSNFNGSSTMDNAVPEDDDYHYLLSLHPYMKQLTAAQKLRIRTKIQRLIFKELYKEELDEMK